MMCVHIHISHRTLQLRNNKYYSIKIFIKKKLLQKCTSSVSTKYKIIYFFILTFYIFL